MSRAALVLLCAACAATPPSGPAVTPLPRRLVDPGECSADGGASCYQKGRTLLEARRSEWAQASMEYIDKSCAAGRKDACDLSELAFKAPRRIAGRNPQIPVRVRQEHRAGTVTVRCILDTGGLLQDCVVIESVPGMDEEVLDSISTRRYEPATWGGHPVEVPFDISIDVNP